MPRPTRRAYRGWRASLAIAVGVVTGGATSSMVLTATLDHGLTLIVDPGDGAGLTVEAWVGDGARDEAGAAGVAHLAEHVALAHAERAAGDRLRAAGVALDGWVTPDATVFRAVSPDPGALAAALAAVGHATHVGAAGVGPGDELLVRERAAIAAEPPRAPLALALLAQAWPRGYPAGPPVAPAPDAAAVAAYWRRSYRSARTTLVVRGAGAAAVRRAQRQAWPHAHSRRSGPPASAHVGKPAGASLALGPDRWAIGLPVLPLVSAPIAELALAAALATAHVGWLAGAEVDAVELIALAGGGLFAILGRGHPPGADDVVAALAGLAGADPAALAAARARVACPVPGVRGCASELAAGGHLAGDPAWSARFRQRLERTGAAELARAIGGLDPARAVRIAAAAPARRVARQARPAPTPAPAAVAPVRATLRNGLRVVAARAPGAARVAIRVAWPGGFAVDPAGAPGTTALLAAALPSVCGARDVPAEVATLDGELAGVAGRWSLGLRSSWPLTTWQDGLALVADCLVAPRFAPAAIDRERERLRELAAAIAGSAARRGFRAYLAARWGAHPLGREPVAGPSELDALDRADLVRAFAGRYRPGAAVLVVVGDVDPADAIAAIRARLDKIPAGKPATTAPTAAAPRAPAREVYVDGPAGTASIVIGLPGLAAGDADRAGLDVLAAILDGPRGRLARALPPSTGARAIAVRVTDGPDAGYLAIELATAPPAAPAVDAVRAALETLAADGPTAAELAAAQAALAPSATPAARADALALRELDGVDRDAALAAVDLAAVGRVAARVLRWDDATVVVVRPPDSTPGVRRRQLQRTPARRRPPRPSRRP